MIGPDPAPRKNLFTVGDADAWAEQFHFLFYVLGMDAKQIAQIDHGFDPDDPNAWLAYSWEHDIECDFPYVHVGRMITATMSGRA
jgi:hypothetical protein